VKRAQAWLQALGPAGVIGVGVLFFCIPFYFSAVQPAERELQAQRLAAERLRNRTPYQPVSSGGREDELRRFYSLFPPVEKLPDELERLFGLARAANLELFQGEYRLEKTSGHLMSYRITLPLRGGYTHVRAFVRSALADMPIASLDALRFERKRAGDTQIEAQLRMTVYFRSGNEGETP
jgi:hypothetical protein